MALAWVAVSGPADTIDEYPERGAGAGRTRMTAARAAGPINRFILDSLRYLRVRGRTVPVKPPSGSSICGLHAPFDTLQPLPHVLDPLIREVSPCGCTQANRSGTWPWWATARAERPALSMHSRSWPAVASDMAP